MSVTPTHVDFVLVVETDDGVALPLRCALERAGHPVERVATAAAALDRVSTGGIALVVLAAALPDMDGAELADRILVGQPGLALLLMTHGQGGRDGRTIDAPVAQLAMPFSLRDLLVEVHALIGHAQPRIPLSRAKDDRLTSPCRGATAETVVGQVPQNVV